MAAQRQVSVDPGLHRGQPQFLQPGCPGPGERVIGQVGKHRAAPQIQGLAQRPGGLGVPARLQRGPPCGAASNARRSTSSVRPRMASPTDPGRASSSSSSGPPIPAARPAPRHGAVTTGVTSSSIVRATPSTTTEPSPRHASRPPTAHRMGLPASRLERPGQLVPDPLLTRPALPCRQARSGQPSVPNPVPRADPFARVRVGARQSSQPAVELATDPTGGSTRQEQMSR